MGFSVNLSVTRCLAVPLDGARISEGLRPFKFLIVKVKIIYLFVSLLFTFTIKAQLRHSNIETEHLPKVNVAKDSLKVLHIGNSFTENSTSYLSKMVKAAGVNTNDMCLYRCIRGGGSFFSFINCWNDKDAKGYSISRVIGGITLPIESSATPYDGTNIRKAFTDCKWDLIIIQQLSSYSHKYTLWNNEDKGGCLPELVDLIRTYQPQAAIGVNLVHASYTVCSNTDSLFHLIADSYHQFCIDYDVDFVIPYGTAIQNIRHTSINTTQYGFSNDLHHLAIGVGQYVANATYFETLITPRYGVSVLGNQFRVDITDSQKEKNDYPEELVPVTDENAYLCQKAAILAIHDKFNINLINDEGEILGVTCITQKAENALNVYDLKGRAVNEKTLKSGVYIKNGKKVVIK